MQIGAVQKLIQIVSSSFRPFEVIPSDFLAIFFEWTAKSYNPVAGLKRKWVSRTRLQRLRRKLAPHIRMNISEKTILEHPKETRVDKQSLMVGFETRWLQRNVNLLKAIKRPLSLSVL